MADLKISQLTSATLPLAGTEVLPIVQSSSTKKVATDDLTVKNVRSNATTGILQVAGPGANTTRVATVPDANFTVARTDAAQSFTGDQTLSTGNLIIGTAGKGIDFSDTPGAGTSELLNDYEEGTWTPVDDSGASLTFSNAFGYYTKVGDVVTAFGRVTFPTTASALTIVIGGLPFVVAANNQPGGGFIRLTNSGRSDTVVASATTSQFLFYANNINAAVNSDYSDDRVDFVIVYKV